jgi:hypothetical protein
MTDRIVAAVTADQAGGTGAYAFERGAFFFRDHGLLEPPMEVKLVVHLAVFVVYPYATGTNDDSRRSEQFFELAASLVWMTIALHAQH